MIRRSLLALLLAVLVTPVIADLDTIQYTTGDGSATVRRDLKIVGFRPGTVASEWTAVNHEGVEITISQISMSQIGFGANGTGRTFNIRPAGAELLPPRAVQLLQLQGTTLTFRNAPGEAARPMALSEIHSLESFDATPPSAEEVAAVMAPPTRPDADVDPSGDEAAPEPERDWKPDAPEMRAETGNPDAPEAEGSEASPAAGKTGRVRFWLFAFGIAAVLIGVAQHFLKRRAG